MTSATRAGEAPQDLAVLAREELAHRFEIAAVLARREHSVLCDAREQGRGRRVALRVMARRHIATARQEPAVLRAIAEAALEHPHVASVHEWGVTSRLVWYAMQFVEGTSLMEVLQSRGCLSQAVCRRIAGQVGGALQYAHNLGVVHGDVRPGNVVLDAQDRAFVTDFAIARLRPVLGGAVPEQQPPGRRTPESLDETGVTGLDAASDQRGLAALVWECLTGASPHAFVLAGEAGYQGTPFDELTHDVPRPVCDAVRRALSRRSQEQFPRVLNFVAALSATEPASGIAEPVRPAGAATPPVLLVRGSALGHPWSRVAFAMALLVVTGFVWQSVRRPSADREPLRAAADPRPAVVAARPLYAGPPLREAPPAQAAIEQPVEPSPKPPLKPPPVAVATARPSRSAARRPLPPPLTPGSLDISSVPWGRLYVDGLPMGNTPKAGLSLLPGTHVVRVVRDGYRAFERAIVVESGRRIRLVGIALEGSEP